MLLRVPSGANHLESAIPPSDSVGRAWQAVPQRRALGPVEHVWGVPVAVSVELDKALDKGFKGKSVVEVLDSPVAALSGVSETDAEHLAAAFNIKTVRDLGTNKFFTLAAALVALGSHVD